MEMLENAATEEWLKQDTEASWFTVLSASRTVKENTSLCPQEPHTKNYIEALIMPPHYLISLTAHEKCIKFCVSHHIVFACFLLMYIHNTAISSTIPATH